MGSEQSKLAKAALVSWGNRDLRLTMFFGSRDQVSSQTGPIRAAAALAGRQADRQTFNWQQSASYTIDTA